jgi:hypothetical protein
MPHRTLRISLIAAVLFTGVCSVRGATLYVTNNGIDPPGCVPSFCILGQPCSCGTKTNPCRSITCGIMRAATGDTIIVGPGVYGDLDGDGTPGDSPGEETPSSDCGCMLSVNKGVTLLSSDGSAATTIDARTVAANTNVLIISGSAPATFGKPGQGFAVTNLNEPSGAGNGITIDATNVTVSGNQVVGISALAGPEEGNVGHGGIETVNAPESIFIEANQISGWEFGIHVLGGTGKTVRKNQINHNEIGIAAQGPAVIGSNVVSHNGIGIAADSTTTIVANGVYGNVGPGVSVEPSVGPGSGTVEKNDLLGNGNAGHPFGLSDCGLLNQGVVGLVASGNYWGAATGPGSRPADNACNAMGGTTTVTPFATKPFKVKAPIKP